MSKEWMRDDLDFYLPDGGFRGMSKEWIMKCIFSESIQEGWKPRVGDVMVGCTGNIFVISSKDELHKDLGGTLWFYGGALCNRDGGCVLDSTYSFTANEDGKWYHPTKGVQDNFYHSSIRDFRYVPYPYEVKGSNSGEYGIEYFEYAGDMLAWIEREEVQPISSYIVNEDWCLLYKK